MSKLTKAPLFYRVSLVKDGAETHYVQIPLGTTSVAHSHIATSKFRTKNLISIWEQLGLRPDINVEIVVTLDDVVQEGFSVEPGETQQLTLSKGHVHSNTEPIGDYSRATELQLVSAPLVGKAKLNTLKGIELSTAEKQAVANREKSIQLNKAELERVRQILKQQKA